MRNNLFLGLVLLLATSALQAAPIQSDNFDDGALGAQWAVPTTSGTATVGESGGTLNMVATGSGSGANMKTASGYVLSGDFDITMDVNINSIAGTGNGGISITALVAWSPTGGYLSMHHRHAGSGWYELAYKTGGTYQYIFTYQEDVQYRLNRVGGIITGSVWWYNNTWRPVNSTNIGTGDITLEAMVLNYNGATLTDVSFDNLVVPEPATLSLFGLGAFAGLIRRKK